MTINKSLTTLLFCTLAAIPTLAETGTMQNGKEQTETEQTASGQEPTTAEKTTCTFDKAIHIYDTSLRTGWFVEAGLDMTVLNPYGFDFAETFPKGRSFGLSAALGKRFSPEISLRFRMNWENGLPLFRNKRLEWIPPVDPDNNFLSTNMDHGGAMFLYMDVPISLAYIIGGYRPDRNWDVLISPRAGLGGNLGINSWSPYVGMGCGYTYRLNHRLTLYSDLTYAGITSEFFSGIPGAGTGMGVGWGFNGIISLHAGVRFYLGK